MTANDLPEAHLEDLEGHVVVRSLVLVEDSGQRHDRLLHGPDPAPPKPIRQEQLASVADSPLSALLRGSMGERPEALRANVAAVSVPTAPALPPLHATM